MADIFDQIEDVLREYIHGPVRDLRLEVGDDPGFHLLNRMEPVPIGGRHMDGTAGYEASYRVKIQGAGLLKGGSFDLGMSQMGVDNELNTGLNSDKLYPDPTTAPLRSHETVDLYLKKQEGVYPLAQEHVHANLLSNPLENFLAGIIEEVVSLTRRYIMNCFYGSGNGTLAQVNASGGYTIGEGTPVAVKIDAGRPMRFIVGQRYIAGSNVSDESTTQRTWRAGTANTPGIMRCTAHDMKAADTVYFESEPGEGNISLSDNDHLVLEGNIVTGAANVDAGQRVPEGNESLLIDSGTFPGTSASVTQHQHFRSFVEGDDTAKVDPTPDILGELVDLIIEIEKPPPVDMISEQSVRTRYGQFERATQAVVQVPQGVQFTPAGGIEAPVFGHFGRAFRWHSSALVRPNAILGIAPETWLKFIPGGNRTIHWAMQRGGVAGAPGIFRPVTVGAALSKILAAEFDLWCEFGCTDPRRNFRRIGLNNARNQ